MSDNKYILSWRYTESTPKVIRRKWYDIFGSDKIEYVNILRHRIINLTEEEGLALLASCPGYLMDSPIGRLMVKLMGDKASHVQLEEIAPPGSSYIATSTKAKE